MLKTQEHYDLIAQFERDCKPLLGRLEKESKHLWCRGIVYQDGRTNELFIVYRHGYAYGKPVGRAEAAT